MPRRVDVNQKEIVVALRSVGATVQHLHEVGHGCPDLLVGHKGANFLLEVKDKAKPLSKRKLTPDEQKWHDAWQGQVAIVEVKTPLAICQGLLTSDVNFEIEKGARL